MRPTSNRLNELFSYDAQTGQLTRRIGKRAGKPAGTPKKGYISVYADRRSYLAHCIVWAMHYGEWPAPQIDHINRDKSDNRLENLRLATSGENCQNRGKPLGVYFHKGSQKWNAYVYKKRKAINLGYYETKEQALAARAAGVAAHYTHASKEK